MHATDGGHRTATIVVDLGRLPSDVHKVVIAGSMDAGTFDTVPGLKVTVTGQHGRELASFPIQDVERVAAVVFGELYRRGDGWKFRAVGQGWDSGLAGLVTGYGVTVDEDDDGDAGAPDSVALLAAWRTKAAEVLASSGPSGPDWDALWAELRRHRIPESDGREALRPAALHYLHRVLTFAFADDLIEQHEMDEFEEAVRELGIADPAVVEMRRRMQRGLEIGLISNGEVPRVEHTRLNLGDGEVLHLEEPAVYVREAETGLRRSTGKIIATNAKFRFVGGAGADLPWSRIVEVRPEYTNIVISTTARRGSGIYEVSDPEYVAAVLTGAMRKARRTAVTPAQRDSRSVPAAVRTEVWQRDGGACVECQATEYLEFDHVIPWSRGGATSAGNLQLLCRRCNLKKGARI
ncbi:hypothetical protein GCM10009827_071110 [Dactylosporangium maewongense]|uniref:HNH nuclease domain-containing protein n=2 Tax=Dactylosporangium maewongense TaxID=634393 RepID=A0ABN2BLN5_9ACTN